MFAAFAVVHLLVFGVEAPSRPADAADALHRYLSESWQTEDGLPQNAIQAITQTRDGYLWFGTPAGLVRFDGVRFTVFNQGQLPNNNIHALLEDRAGRLWIGTYGGGLFQYAADRFVRVERETGLDNRFIRTLCTRQRMAPSGWAPMAAVRSSGRTIAFMRCAALTG